MIYQTKQTYVGPDLELGGGPTIVETAGYRPVQQQIRDLISAGERLQQARKEDYDYPDGRIDPKDPGDPTRSPGFDLADAQIQAREAKDRLRQRKLEHDAAEAAAAAAKQETGSETPLPDKKTE